MMRIFVFSVSYTHLDVYKRQLGCRIDGGQAEYVRVPFADQGLNKIPDGVTDRQALFVGDVLATGYWAVSYTHLPEGGERCSVIRVVLFLYLVVPVFVVDLRAPAYHIYGVVVE